jgi:hypothetical protein
MLVEARRFIDDEVAPPRDAYPRSFFASYNRGIVLVACFISW